MVEQRPSKFKFKEYLKWQIWIQGALNTLASREGHASEYHISKEILGSTSNVPYKIYNAANNRNVEEFE